MKEIEKLHKSEKKLFDIFTRAEEYDGVLDEHNRFTYKQSKEKDIFLPRVSEYLIRSSKNIEYQDGKPFAVFLSHDVDMLYPPFNHTLRSGISAGIERDFTKIRPFLFWKFKGKEKSPYWNFRKIMELESKYNASSTFFFLTAHRDISHVRYDILDVCEELPGILDNGGEIGLHGGYYAFDNIRDIINEKKELENAVGENVVGYRNHYLRFRIPATWHLIEKAGFRYDSTLGYSDMIGFRNGMCHPFRPYDLNEQKELDIFEIPLAIMDGTLFESCKSYRNAWDAAKKIIDITSDLHGVITLNWHSNTFNCPFKAQWEKMYGKILEYCYQKNAWMTTGENILNWWENKV